MLRGRVNEHSVSVAPLMDLVPSCTGRGPAGEEEELHMGWAKASDADIVLSAYRGLCSSEEAIPRRTLKPGYSATNQWSD